MRILRVELENIGPHRQLHVEFQNGAIGIVGANGAGKSTLVNSVYAALTNDFTRFSTVKSDIITTNSGDAPSLIRIAGEHHGQQFVLTRWLRPNKSEFRIGSQRYTKANEVNDAVTAELNIPKVVIDRYVFVSQWEMFSFLDETPSERAKTFQYLCGTDSAAQIHKACTDFVQQQQSHEILDNSLDLETIVAGAASRVEEADKQIKTLTRQLLSAEDYAYYQALLQRATAAINAESVVKTLATSRRQMETQLTALRQSVDELDAKLSKARNWLQTHATRIGEANAAARAVELQNKIRLQLHSLQQSREQLEAERAKLCNVEAAQTFYQYCVNSFDDDVVAAFRGLSATGYILAEKRAAATQTKMNLFAKLQAASVPVGHADTCQYCLQPISAEYRQKLAATASELRQRHDLLERRLQASTGFDLAKSRRQEKIEVLVRQITQIDSQISECQKTIETQQPANVSESELQSLLATAAKAKVAESQHGTALAIERQKLEGLVTTFAHVDAKITAAEAIIAEGRVDSQTIADAEAALQHRQEVTEQIARQKGAKTEAERSQQRAAEALEKLREQLNTRAKIRNLLSTIAAVGEIFHWNNLPKAVSQANLRTLVSDINRNLELFDTPFTVEADDELTFNVFFPGQLPVKAKQLSGGQKVILAIAFRAAIDKVFGHDVGMLFLDEPTAGLDADNLVLFREALRSLSNRLQANKQLFVITHTPELNSAFDQVVEIQKGN